MSNTERKNSDGVCQQSLLSALNRFVQAVGVMDETVMIPSRLKDMEISMSDQPETNIVEENNNMALMPTIKPGTDMHCFYKLLLTIKDEIITGNNQTGEEVTEDSEGTEHAKECAKKTAALFRHHLGGLFSVLHQMTETAKYLSNRYETEVGDNSSKSLSSFAV